VEVTHRNVAKLFIIQNNQTNEATMIKRQDDMFRCFDNTNMTDGQLNGQTELIDRARTTLRNVFTFYKGPIRLRTTSISASCKSFIRQPSRRFCRAGFKTGRALTALPQIAHIFPKCLNFHAEMASRCAVSIKILKNSGSGLRGPRFSPNFSFSLKLIPHLRVMW